MRKNKTPTAIVGMRSDNPNIYGEGARIPLEERQFYAAR